MFSLYIQIAERMKVVVDSKVSLTEEKLGELHLPRIIRLCRKFKFTENEVKIATYALTRQFEYDDCFGKGRLGMDALSCCRVLNVPLKDMLEFLDKDRIHMEQGFFPEIEQSFILSCEITYDIDFCKALMCSNLKSNEFLKIEQTKLADVIAEEPGNEHYR